MESCTLVGNVGNDPEMRFTPNGAAVTNFNLATYAGKDTEGNKLTTWIRITFWAGLAERVNKHIQKGQRVQVSGYLHPARLYQKNDQSTGASLEMTAFKIGIVPRDLDFVELGNENGESEAEVLSAPLAASGKKFK